MSSTPLRTLLTRVALARPDLPTVDQKLGGQKPGDDQPRVPAGNPGGGRWTSASAVTSDDSSARGKFRSSGKQFAARKSAQFCWNQMQIDLLLCYSLPARQLMGACRSQAMERYAACLNGKPIPPLPF
jgi:hypothetical protein